MQDADSCQAKYFVSLGGPFWRVAVVLSRGSFAGTRKSNYRGITVNEEEALAAVHSALEKGIKASFEDGHIKREDLERSSEEMLALWKQQAETAPTPGKHGAFLPFRYVIPDQDLKLLETVTSVLTTAAGVGFLLPELGYDPKKGVTAAVTGVIVALVKLTQNLQLSVHLDDRDYTLVALLSRGGAKGILVEDLFKTLKHRFPDITNEIVSARLNALMTCATIKGTKSALTWKGADDRWHVNGV